MQIYWNQFRRILRIYVQSKLSVDVSFIYLFQGLRGRHETAFRKLKHNKALVVVIDIQVFICDSQFPDADRQLLVIGQTGTWWSFSRYFFDD